jgi:tRNA threonylcarbamoyladenosine biosynthesis protein TsaE
MKKISHSIKQTYNIAQELAKKILKKNFGSKKAVVIGLSGDLGSGKTTFVQGFAKSLGIKEKIVSPTFVIMRKSEITNLKKFKNLYHLDAYRIDTPKEIIDLGWKDIINEPKNIILAEWAEKIKTIFPKQYFWINFRHID